MIHPRREPRKPPLPYLLAHAATLASRTADAELRRHGLTIRQFGLLTQLRLEPELTMSELARQLGITRQSLHEMVGELEEAGHLRRLPGASGRTRRLILGRDTERLLNRARTALTALEPEFAGNLTAHEIDLLRALLQRLLAHTTDDESWLSGF